MTNDAISLIPLMTRGGARLLEPQAKTLLQNAGIDVPRFTWAETTASAAKFASMIGYPVTAKIVSPDIYCKTERGGVALCLENEDELARAFKRFSGMKGFVGMLVEEPFYGLELNIGISKIDYGLSPAVFMETVRGGPDRRKKVTFRFPPITESTVVSMLREVGLFPRFSDTIDCKIDMAAVQTMLNRSCDLVSRLAGRVEGVFLDPVVCRGDRCVVLDARIKLGARDPLPHVASDPPVFATA